MQAIKNLIARRRPPGADETPDFGSEPLRSDDIAEPEATAENVTDAAMDLERDLNAAQAARDHVPAPVRPTAHQYPDWSKREVTRPAAEEEPASVAAPPPPKQKIWDLEPKALAPVPKAVPDPHTPNPVFADQPRPTSDRAKTRLLGFNAEGQGQDILETPPAASGAGWAQFPIGWLVVMNGPGRGASFTLTAGLSTIGRDEDQTVSLDFGDGAISRQQHVAIAYDEEENRAFIGHGGKSNIVRHNDKPLLTTEDLNNGDRIKIGKTELKFVAFCTPEFSWAVTKTAEAAHG